MALPAEAGATDSASSASSRAKWVEPTTRAAERLREHSRSRGSGEQGARRCEIGGAARADPGERRWTEQYTLGRDPAGAWFLGGELSGIRVGASIVLCGLDRIVVLADGRCGEHLRRRKRWTARACAWEVVEARPERVTLRDGAGASQTLHARGDLLFTTPTPTSRFEPIREVELRFHLLVEARERLRENPGR
ncbi:hypothetical protein SAMN02745121_05871 [Nannocystis exedens]|uniref:Uncharacterized protein n=1 Tax=Nannocystis exedens TaxID=54 RepID=A0A1I2E2L1_9BACT|nr:hypothetical protein [Nannocystis exedens]PCC69226.1 hypothetical protein NAEX_02248 [Nannocystis exedens]SFE86791.1 hypothetical protein SAMN02745121_05871 [Nannocystis exedens]